MAEHEVIVEIPQGSKNKYEADHNTGAIWLDRTLFTSMQYPADYGFFPHTLADDGDPLDALVLHAGGTYPGVLIACQPIAVVEVEQREDGERVRNDRVIAIPAEERQALSYSKDDLDTRMRREVEEFFKSATLFEGKEIGLVTASATSDGLDHLYWMMNTAKLGGVV